MNENKTNINWYPGHMAKAKREIKERLDLVDIVYEVLDSRIPYSSKIRDVDDILKNKEKILILSKKDLCDINETNKWVKHYEDMGYTVLIMDLTNNIDYKQLIKVTNDLFKDKINKRKEKGIINEEIKVLVIGIPNVGKSTLINCLAGKRITETGNKPGVTKSLNWIKTNSNLLLLDTPGILWPKLDKKKVALNLASTAAIKSDVIPMVDVCTYILQFLNDYYPNILKDKYNISSSLDIMEMYKIIANKIGANINGDINYLQVANKVYNDIVSGRIKGITFDIWGS